MLLLIPTPIGNLGDVTLRSLSALAAAQVVLCEDTRVAKRLYTFLHERFAGLLPHLLPLLEKHLPPAKHPNSSHNPNRESSTQTQPLDTPYSLDAKSKQFIPLHSHNQSSLLATLSPEFFSAHVIYISDAGMPGVCDPGAELARYCLEQAIPYEALPGACALTTAWAHSGISSQGFVFGGFLAHKAQDKRQQVLHLLESNAPLIFYESPHRLLDSLQMLASIIPEGRVFAIKELSKLYQSHFQGSPKEVLEALKSANIQGEWVLILQASPSPRIHLDESELLSLPLPPKIKAKLLSRLLGTDTKSLYQRVLEEQK